MCKHCVYTRITLSHTDVAGCHRCVHICTKDMGSQFNILHSEVTCDLYAKYLWYNYDFLFTEYYTISYASYGDAITCPTNISHACVIYSINTQVMDGHASRVFSLKYHPTDPHLLISGGWDDTVQVCV